jgi:hypothetical protein
VPELPPYLQAAQARVIQFADKLFEALDDLHAAGGMTQFAAHNPKAAGKVAVTLRSVRLAIDRHDYRPRIRDSSQSWIVPS